ncbi:Detected protein of confused Function [Hibiscus syriacus]|uniref:Detected protein of confused Function n=1 Tax=Hibiscus syriacus TaxID=106335 RepID=A0A6A3BU84_HIBSY|nr:Detected protein of confused Function [Hibiscus syriacus]
MGDFRGKSRVNSGSMGKQKGGFFGVVLLAVLEGVVAVAVAKWDVLGLGQAMVDFSGMVDDEFLERLGLEKGTRKVINHEERGRVLRAMDGCSYKAAAGGSLSNSLVALARLGYKPIGGSALNVAMAGSVGSDPLGGFYRVNRKGWKHARLDLVWVDAHFSVLVEFLGSIISGV